MSTMGMIIVYTVYWLLIVMAIITVVMENRNTYKAVAWILLIFFLPIIGFVLYVIFGRDLRHTRYMKGSVYHKILTQSTIYPSEELVSMVSCDALYQPLVQLIGNNARSLLRSADSIEIYTRGHEKYESLFRDIEQAQKHIHIEYYIIEKDELGKALRNLLIRKAQQGVEVRILYDGLGSLSLGRDFWASLVKAGGEVYGFFPLRFPYYRSHINYRNHRKIVVIDGTIGYVGGMNVAKRYTKGNQLGAWRDSHFRIEGGAVSGLQRAFVIDWGVASRKEISCAGLWGDGTEPSKSTIPMQVLTNGSMRKWKTIEQAIVKAIYLSRHSILIQTPYFLPTEGISRALIAASLRGVRICIMIPRNGDSIMTQAASNSFLSDFIDIGVEVYLYTEGFLHSKLMMFDSKMATIGSANIDYRSMELNMEINAFVYDADFTSRLEVLFMEDCKKCILLEKEEWQKRGRIRRYWDSIFRLFAPML